MYLLQTLFFEQRCRIRGSGKANAVDSRTARVVAKGVLIRRALYVHLKSLFPKWAEECELIMSKSYYKTKYGVDENGCRANEDAEEEDEEEEAEDDTLVTPEKLSKDAGGIGASTYVSKARSLLLHVDRACRSCVIVLNQRSSDQAQILTIDHPIEPRS